MGLPLSVFVRVCKWLNNWDITGSVPIERTHPTAPTLPVNHFMTLGGGGGGVHTEKVQKMSFPLF